MQKQNLCDENWTVRAVGDLSEVPSALRDVSVPAIVPGCVHTDLIRAGKLEDPYRDLNEFKTRWIGHTDWQYRTTFDADPKLFDHERIDLACDGLDTVARVELNGTLVGETFNMHRRYRFDVRKLLKRGPSTSSGQGRNELTITFASPVKYAESMRAKLGHRPYVNGPAGPFNFIRKMACNFGWDWGPALPTSGIWKAVRLEGWNRARLKSVLPVTMRAAENGAQVDVQIDIDGDPHGTLLNVVMCGEGQERVAGSFDLRPDSRSMIVSLKMDRARLWWPRGYGGQFQYELVAGLRDERGYQLDDGFCIDYGLRTVELDSSPDEIGRKFVIKVNGKPIFCKGFNWIPDDCFLDRATEPARIRQRIQQAIDTGANMLRVWGGGIYETDDFYNICDELGVMVWQDFPFACAMYPEEQPFHSEVEAEARDNVARLASHPSLTIWNGCNENLWGYRDWGWKDDPSIKNGATWGKGYYFDLLPKVVGELTPGVPYWAGSPWSGDYDVDKGVPPNADTHGNMHCWAPWFREDYSAYRKFSPRFSSEFGFQAPATYASIASVVPADQRDFGSLEMRHRQKSGNPAADDGDKRNLRHLLKHFNIPGAQELLDALEVPEPKPTPPLCGSAPLLPARTLPSRANFDDLHYLLQVNQARALTLGVEWMRSRQPRCMGALYWQLNDCWPGVTSWSCIDGDGRMKPLWYATRRFFAERLCTFQPELNGSISLYVINDTDGKFEQKLGIARLTFAGAVLAEQNADLCVAPRSVFPLPIAPHVAQAGDPSREFLTIVDPYYDATWFFAPDKDLVYPEPEFISDWTDGRLTIRAKTFIRDACVFVDRLDPEATVDQQLVTLLPRQAATFHVHSRVPLKCKQLTGPPVFRCVNDFGGR